MDELRFLIRCRCDPEQHAAGDVMGLVVSSMCGDCPQRECCGGSCTGPVDLSDDNDGADGMCE